MDDIRKAQRINRIIEKIVENKAYDHNFYPNSYNFEGELLYEFLISENNTNILNFITESSNENLNDFISSLKNSLTFDCHITSIAYCEVILRDMLKNYYYKKITETTEQYIQIMNYENNLSVNRGYYEDEN